jgi:hypothetical protein
MSLVVVCAGFQGWLSYLRSVNEANENGYVWLMILLSIFYVIKFLVDSTMLFLLIKITLTLKHYIEASKTAKSKLVHKILILFEYFFIIRILINDIVTPFLLMMQSVS